MLNEKQKLDALVDLGVGLNQVQDLDILMERILTEARRFVGADAGSIYISNDQRLHFAYTQNDTLQGRLAKGENLIFSTFAIPINDNSIAGCVANSDQQPNLPDVYRLDPGCPYHFDKTIDRKTHYVTQSVLTIPLHTSNKDLLGILQMINACDDSGHVDIACGDPLPGFTKPDGSARGKKHEEIPLLGRLVAIADVYDALSTARVYKEAWDESDVVAKIKSESGRQFDPELVEIFLSCLKILRSIQKRYRDNED